jgi:hypothetical protein
VGHQALGHEVKLVPEAFDQYAAMALDLFPPFVHLPTQLLELPVNSFELPVDSFESAVDPLLQRLESGIEVLNEFLIHAAPAKEKSMPLCCPCQ